MGWATNGVAWSIPAAPVTSTPIVVPAKRRGDEFHPDGASVIVESYGMPPQKRVRSDKPNGILEATRSAPRTRHKSVARIPKTMIKGKPKKAGRGAERLVVPDSQGIYHRSLLGPSLQQGWAIEAADGQLVWVEGSVEDVVQGIDNTVQQQLQEEDEYFEIPKDLKTGYQALLVATKADWARGAVRKIKCRLRSRSTFASIAGITSHAVIRANGTATIGPLSVSE